MTYHIFNTFKEFFKTSVYKVIQMAYKFPNHLNHNWKTTQHT